MDNRLFVTVAFVVHLIGGILLAIAYTMVSVEFTDGQLEFLLFVAYLCPLVAFGLIWAKNYTYGAPLLVISSGSGCWFALYFFHIHHNTANVAAVTGEGAGAYFYATIAVIFGLFVICGVGAWLWYQESDGFQSIVNSVLRPPEQRQ